MFVKRREKGKRLQVIPTIKKEEKQNLKPGQRPCVPFEYRNLFFNSGK